MTGEAPARTADGQKTCVVPPPGLQGLLMAAGLVDHLATTGHAVVVCVASPLLPALPRLFAGMRVRFWVDQARPEAHARSMGYRPLLLPPTPRDMYALVDLQPSAMHARFKLHVDRAAAERRADQVVDRVGPTYALVWDAEGTAPISDDALPPGVPVVRVEAAMLAGDPFALSGVMARATQVHAPDGWFLLLADLVGGVSKKVCHAYVSRATLDECRARYRRSVTVCASHPAAAPPRPRPSRK
jgi:hypothetical protein